MQSLHLTEHVGTVYTNFFTRYKCRAFIIRAEGQIDQQDIKQQRINQSITYQGDQGCYEHAHCEAYW